MTNFKPGDRVRVTQPRSDAGVNALNEGDIHVIRKVRPSFDGTRQIIYLEGKEPGYYASRFEPVSEAPGIPVQPGDIAFVVEVSHQGRSYDASKGDERRFDQQRALALAEERAIERGVRQQVRKVGPALAGGDPLWLIQDVA